MTRFANKSIALTSVLLLLAMLAASCGSDKAATADAIAVETNDGFQTDPGASPDIRPPVDLEEQQQETSREDFEALVEEGKQWLANGEPGFALKAFEKALELDENHPDAIFGAGLAEYVRNIELFAMILTLPNQFGAYGAGEWLGIRPESENDYLAEETHKIFMYLREGFVAAEAHLKRLGDPGFSWVIEQVPISVFTKPVVNMRGRFDLADVHFILSTNALLLWFTELIAAQDLHSDLLTMAYSAIVQRDQGLDVFGVLELASFLMASDSRFLELHQQDGAYLFKQGSQHIKDTGYYLLHGLELLENGDDGFEGEVTWLEYHKGNPVLMLRNRVDFHTQEEEIAAIEFHTELLDRSWELLDAMETPGEVVSFTAGPVLQLGITLGFANKLDLLRFMPVEIPIDVSDLEPAEIVALLSMFMGDSLGFDFGTLFNNPIGLRSILPIMVAVPEPSGPEDFWMEWECPAETEETGSPISAGGFVCSGNAELLDAPHFIGTVHEILPDEFPSALPYLVWEDPSWGGFLAVDEYYLDSTGDPQNFVVPDLWLVNLGVHLWLDPISGLLR